MGRSGAAAVGVLLRAWGGSASRVLPRDSGLARAQRPAQDRSRHVNERALTIAGVIAKSAAYLAERGSTSPRLDAELLLAHALGTTRLGLYLDSHRPLNAEELARMRELLKRRGRHEPVAYILGRKEFYGRDFVVTPAVLVPRPETECLVEHVLGQLQQRFGPEAPLDVLEFGTGSGAVAITLALNRRSLRVISTEISPAAAAIARQNAASHGVQDRVSILVQGDFEGVTGPFHAVVANPPYVAECEAECLPPDVRDYEPAEALFGGPDGLRWITWLLEHSAALLAPEGFLAMEIGAGMAERVRREAERRDWAVEAIVPDYHGLERVVRCAPRRPGSARASD